MPEESESTWDIRDDLSFVHLYCTDEHLRDVGEKIWDKRPLSLTLEEKSSAAIRKSPPFIASFCSAATGSKTPISSP